MDQGTVERQCSNCLHFKRPQDAKGGGICMRFPPQAFMDTHETFDLKFGKQMGLVCRWGFPAVKDTWVCGEWATNPS